MTAIRSQRTSRAPAAPAMDPLFVIFEQHLYNFQDSDLDRKAFIWGIIKDYLSYLRKLKIIVPKSLEGQIVEELSSQVSTMLVKKIYGFLSIEEYQKHVSKVVRKKARSRYSKLAKR